MPEIQPITKAAVESFWTVENVDRLIERHAAGLTHGEIANEFGVTRNKDLRKDRKAPSASQKSAHERLPTAAGQN